MRSDFSNWSHKPENPVILQAYVESAIVEGLTFDQIPVVVWRDGELTVTLNPREGERDLEYKFIDRRIQVANDERFEPLADEEESTPL
jgi:hypothetical protein